MKKAIALAPVLALLFAAPPVMATAPADGASTRPAAIPFANHSVRNWVSEGDQVIYFEASGRRWYRAVLFAPSTDLPFAQAIGFDTGPAGTLDKWSTLVIRGQRYPIRSFERVDGPPSKARKAKANQSETPA